MDNNNEVLFVCDDECDTSIAGMIANWLSDLPYHIKITVVSFSRFVELYESFKPTVITLIFDNPDLLFKAVTSREFVYLITENREAYWNVIALGDCPDNWIYGDRTLMGTDSIKDKYLFDMELNAKWNN